MSYAVAHQKEARRGRRGLGCACGAPVSGLGCICGMAGLGTLTTPDHTIWLPGQIRAWLDQINEQIRSLDTDINSHRAAITRVADGPRFITDWNLLKSQWLTFNHDASTAWGSTVDAAQEYVNRYNALEQRYHTVSGERATVSTAQPDTDMPSTIHAVNTNLMLWAGIGIIGIGTIGYLLSQYAKIKTVSKLAFNRRRRARRRR